MMRLCILALAIAPSLAVAQPKTEEPVVLDSDWHVGYSVNEYDEKICRLSVFGFSGQRVTLDLTKADEITLWAAVYAENAQQVRLSWGEKSFVSQTLVINDGTQTTVDHDRILAVFEGIAQGMKLTIGEESMVLPAIPAAVDELWRCKGKL